jgi:GT2 family glycosyltransferase
MESGGNLRFVAIINSFNRRELLVRAIDSLLPALNSTGLEFAVVVFEAGSTDGSREWLSEFVADHRDLRIEVVFASETETPSFADGVNRGCQHALETFPEVEFLFLYETDNWLSSAEPVMRAIQLLREQPHLAAAGFTVRLHSGKPCGWGEPFPTVPSFVLGQQLSHRLKVPRSQVRILKSGDLQWFPADVVYTSPLVIRASTWRELGGMDAELFPFSDSDLDWAWKVSQAGYRCGVLLSDGVVHDNGGSSSSWSNMRVLKFHQSRFRLLRKYRGEAVVFAIPALFLRHVAEFLLLSALVLTGRRPIFSLRKRSILLRSVWSGYESLRS